MHEQAQHSAQSNAETQTVRQLVMIPAELQAGGKVRQQRGALALGDGASYLLGRRTIQYGEFAISSRETLLPKKAKLKASRLACEWSARSARPTSSSGAVLDTGFNEILPTSHQSIDTMLVI